MKKTLEKWLKTNQYEKLLAGTHERPCDILGVHDMGKGQIVTVYRPYAQQVILLLQSKKDEVEELELEPYDEEGLFWIYSEKKKIKKYRLRIVYHDDDAIDIDDAYRFEGIISEYDTYLFAEGKHYEVYNKLGAHPRTVDGVSGTNFAVWAPHAESVRVAGDFNMWDGRLHMMNRVDEEGIYELFIPGIETGTVYKYQIGTKSGEYLYKADPYAHEAQLRPDNASVVSDIEGFEWTDSSYMKKWSKKSREDLKKEPMAIYELHLGSWKKKDDGTEDGFYNYRELAPMVTEYIKEMGYTHVELMGIAEHPFDGSWGYQVTGYYAPTKRYGSPKDFMYFVNYLHENDIRIILDWVPAHFPRDEHGLRMFDGEALYEHPDRRRGEHPHWGTMIFNYGKNEVENFLIANALFWMEKYHIDGLRVDAVASMLYLDYGKEDGEWIPNEYGGNGNLEAVAMFRHMSQIIEEKQPGKMLIAEESTAWPKVSGEVKEDGLGFLFKWNMGWMNDFLEYMRLDPYFRQYNHGKLIFSIVYAYSENFIQVLSHDEVVHGKGSMINKMYGDVKEKFASLRAAYGFMYGHPGKKLLFMGQEFAQWREWSEARSLDWELLEQKEHVQMQQFVKDLNKMYQEYSCLYVHDCNELGFEWMSCEDNERSVVAFVRRNEAKSNHLLFVCNFTPVYIEDYRVGVPCAGSYKEILNSDSCRYGGEGRENTEVVKADALKCNGRKCSIEIKLPPLSVVAFRFNYSSRAKGRMVKKVKSSQKKKK